MISRLSRSASAWTVVSISSFCSSLRRVQRLSIAWTKPFTPVSGDRSSWATAATRSDRSRSRRARPRPERTETATPIGGPSGLVAQDPRRDQALVAVGQHPRLLGDAGAGARPLERRVVLQPGTSVVAGQREHVDELRPTTFERSTPNSCSAARLTSTTVSLRSKMTTPSARTSTASPLSHPRPAPYAEHCASHRRVAPRDACELRPAMPSSFAS